MTRRFQVLSLSGGGFRGLHVARVLELIEQQTGSPAAKHFDLLAGTSIGGIIALALAAEIPAKKITDALEKLGPTLFPKPVPSFPAIRDLVRAKGFVAKAHAYWRLKKKIDSEVESLRRSWYDPSPLKELLSSEDYFGTRTMGDLKHPVIVPAINYNTGQPKFFKTPHHHTFIFDRNIPLVDVALGTSAAPIYFPVHKINDIRVVDGGLVANDPTHVAVHEALNFFGVRPPLFGDQRTGLDDLRVLAIGTLVPKRFGAIDKPLDIGVADWITGPFELAMSAQEVMSAFMVDKHMLPGRVIRLPTIDGRPETAPGLADTDASTIEILRASAQILAQNAFGDSEFNELFLHQAETLDELNSRQSNRSDT